MLCHKSVVVRIQPYAPARSTRRDRGCPGVPVRSAVRVGASEADQTGCR